MNDKRTLVAHEWIETVGGAEKVLREFLNSFPDADVYCLWNDAAPETFDRPVRESPMAQTVLRGRKALGLPFMPRIWRNIPLEDYQAVIASSHAFAHHVAGHAARAGIPAFAYVHTPARYIWAPEVEIRGQGIIPRIGSVPLRRTDRNAVDHRVNYAANSEYIRRRIQRSWKVDAQVIYPPVNVEIISAVSRWRDKLTPQEDAIFDRLPTGGFVLGASRLVSYKRLDKVIEVGELLQMPVVLAGSGPGEQELRHLASRASVPVHFAGRVTDHQLYALYQEAALFVFMAVEDFGIMPVECMATGTPVLVGAHGGARESVVKVGGGVAADHPSASLREMALEAIGRRGVGAGDAIEMFGLQRFGEEVREWVRSNGAAS